jgi:hypothetical protein
MTTHRIGLHMTDRTPRAQRAREDLVEALGGVECQAPDGDGTFCVEVDAPDKEDALHVVWNAMAAAGADDHIVFLEHPDVPRHWEHRPAGAEPPHA